MFTLVGRKVGRDLVLVGGRGRGEERERELERFQLLERRLDLARLWAPGTLRIFGRRRIAQAQYTTTLDTRISLVAPLSKSDRFFIPCSLKVQCMIIVC